MPNETRTRDITVTKELGYSKITIHRPKFFYFEFIGLRPSTPHWMFFGAKEVTKWVNTSYSKSDFENAGRNSIIKEPGEKFTSYNRFPSGSGLPYSGRTAGGGASDPLFSDANGILKGLFYLQSNSSANWPMKSGGTELLAIDILGTDRNKSYSYASTLIKGAGQYENYWTGTEKETYTVWVEPPRVVNNNSNDNDKTYVIHSNGTITTGVGVGTQETYSSFHEAAVAISSTKRHDNGADNNPHSGGGNSGWSGTSASNSSNSSSNSSGGGSYTYVNGTGLVRNNSSSMYGSACFSYNTLFRMSDGSTKQVSDIKVGDQMFEGGYVYAVIQGDGNNNDWYEYKGIHVTGDHPVLDEGTWKRIKDVSNNKIKRIDGYDKTYTLLNTNHLMVSHNNIWFTDYDEIEWCNNPENEQYVIDKLNDQAKDIKGIA